MSGQHLRKTHPLCILISHWLQQAGVSLLGVYKLSACCKSSVRCGLDGAWPLWSNITTKNGGRQTLAWVPRLMRPGCFFNQPRMQIDVCQQTQLSKRKWCCNLVAGQGHCDICRALTQARILRGHRNGFTALIMETGQQYISLSGTYSNYQQSQWGSAEANLTPHFFHPQLSPHKHSLL